MDALDKANQGAGPALLQFALGVPMSNVRLLLYCYRSTDIEVQVFDAARVNARFSLSLVVPHICILRFVCEVHAHII